MDPELHKQEASAAMRKTIISLVVGAAIFVPTAALADGMPGATEAPKGSPAAAANASTEKVTQADLQPNAPDTYTVVKGDTLWGISGKFLKDPWKWPQIWNMNRDEIKDPHWIYPGDVIYLDRSGANPSLRLGAGGGGVGGGAVEGPGAAEANVVKLEPRVRVEPLRTAIPTIPASVLGPFLTQPLIVEAGGFEAAPTILATTDERVVVGAGDTAYADRIGPGDSLNWQVYRPGDALKDPESGELLGYEAHYVGDVRVRRYGDRETATTLDVIKSAQEINRGDRLAPARESTFPSFIPHAPGKLVRGVIMSVDGGVSELGQFQVVAINRGSRDGIEVGHVLATMRKGEPIDAYRHTTYLGWHLNLPDMRPNPVVPDVPSRTHTSEKSADIARGSVRLPDERTGLLLVFRVFERMSYGIIMRAARPIYVGDVVQTP
jgi:LysM domain